MGTDKVKSLFCSVLPHFQRNTAFWEGRRLHPFHLMVRATWNEYDCGALMEWCCQENNWSTQRGTCLSSTLSNTYFVQADLGSNLSLHNETRASDHKALAWPYWQKTYLSVKNFSFCLEEKTYLHLMLFREIIDIYWES